MSRATVCLLETAFAVACLSLSASAQLSFSTAQYGVRASGESVATGDFDGDGLPDLAVGNGHTISVFLATAPGQYSAHADFDIASEATEIVVADFNGDGHLDILAGNGPMTLLLGDGNGNFTPNPVSIGNPNLSGDVVALAAADFNGDGSVDVVVGECTNSGCVMTVFLNDGAGNFAPGAQLASLDQGSAISGIVAVDLNKDGHPDIASEFSNPLRGFVYFNDGNGNFTLHQDIALTVAGAPADSGPAIGKMTWADLNNDAAPDLIFLAGWRCGSACGNMQALVYMNDGAGNFISGSSTTVWTSGSGGALLSSDLDGDFRPDLVFWSAENFIGGATFWLGNGDGTFLPASSNFNPVDSFHSGLIARDLDLDARHDLVATSVMAQSAIVALNTSATANCAPPGADRVQAKICEVTDLGSGSFVVTASGNAPTGAVRMEFWVDGQKQGEIWDDQLRRNVSFFSGAHTIEVVAVDAYGGIGRTNTTVNAGGGGGGTCTAASNTVHLCLPVNGSTVTSPVEVSGAANLPGFAWLRLYIDDQIAFEGPNPAFDTTLPLSAGSHHTVLVGYSSIPDTTDQSTFTVGGGACTAAPNSANLCAPTDGPRSTRR